MSCPFLHVCNVWKYMKVSTNHLPLDSHYGMRCVKIVSFPFISSRSGDGSKAIIYFYYYHVLGNKHPLASYDWTGTVWVPFGFDLWPPPQCRQGACRVVCGNLSGNVQRVMIGWIWINTNCMKSLIEWFINNKCWYWMLNVGINNYIIMKSWIWVRMGNLYIYYKSQLNVDVHQGRCWPSGQTLKDPWSSGRVGIF